eukprot:11186628-Lingulodinium_polyedra.AAC.1
MPAGPRRPPRPLAAALAGCRGPAFLPILVGGRPHRFHCAPGLPLPPGSCASPAAPQCRAGQPCGA